MYNTSTRDAVVNVFVPRLNKVYGYGEFFDESDIKSSKLLDIEKQKLIWNNTNIMDRTVDVLVQGQL